MPTIPTKKSLQNNFIPLSGGIALVKYEITDIIDHSNAPGKSISRLGKNDFVPELCIELVLTSGKYEYKKYLFGNYLWETDKISGKPTVCLGWLTKKNAIYDFLSELSDSDIQINDDFTLQSEYLKSFIGRNIFIIRYPTENGTKDFWLIKEATEANKLELINTFHKYVPKDYVIKKHSKSDETQSQPEEDIF